jgi:glycosyltransferase involved in cell wall biosynthesis
MAIGPAPDIALISLGTTPGLRRADDAFAALCEDAGLACEVVRVDVGRAARLRRQSTLTDIVEARAARKAAAGVHAKVIVYSSVTAALLQKPSVPYAVRFDSPAAQNRPGPAGIWSRRREAKVLAKATLLLPWGYAALKAIPPEARDVPAIPLHVPIADGQVPSSPGRDRDIDALAYAGYPEKRGLDILLDAWRIAGPPSGRRLCVTGIDATRARDWLRGRNVEEPPGVEWSGLLEPRGFRDLLGVTKLFVNASRREDHGLSQLEALAAGAALVTVASEGAYEALPLAIELDDRLVAPTVSGPSLASALRTGFGVNLGDYAARAAQLLAPYRLDAIREVFTQRVVPALGLR